MTNEFEGYLAITSLIIELEQKLKVFWNGGEQGFTKQASKLIKKNNFKKCVHVVSQTPNFSSSSISITGSPEINFNSQNSFAVLSDFTGKDDVFLRSPLATLFNPPLFSTPTGDTSSFSNIRYTLSSSGMPNSTSSNISNSQIKKSQSWRTLVININTTVHQAKEQNWKI